MPLSPGQTLKDRYRIERLLGQGGFGAVYLAWDLNLDGAVAVKENVEPGEESALDKALDTGQSSVRQFQLEAKILFQLRHPNLPRVSDFFSIPGQGQYLVMDYIEGEDLEMMLERAGGPLPYERALAWIIQVCEALSYLHAQQPPIIHRDIKPANIRITRTTTSPLGQAILVDFGIAKLYNPSTKTTVGARAVTLNYSPPEQYGLGKTDAQSDLYALGATAYHMLTGVTPAPAVDVMSGNTPPPLPAQQVNPQVAPGVGQAIEKAMQVQRQARWASVEEFATALRAAQAGISLGSDMLKPAPASAAGPAALPETERASGASLADPFATSLVQPGTQSAIKFELRSEAEKAPPSAGEGKPARLPLRRRKLLMILLALPVCVACLLVAGIIYSQTGGKMSPEAPLPGESPTEEVGAPMPSLPGKKTKAPSTASVSQAPPPSETPSPSPQAPEAEFVYPGAPIGLENIGQLEQLARWGEGTLNLVALSADGRVLAAASSLGIYLYDARTLDVLDLIETDLWIDRLSVAPDGSMVAAVSWEAVIRVWSLEGLSEEGCPEDGCALLYTLEGHTNTVTDVAFSPDGTRLASVSSDGSLRLWDLTSGVQIQEGVAEMVAPDVELTRVVYSPDGSLLATGDSAGTIRLWDAYTGELLQELSAQDGMIVSLAFAPDGRLLASASTDETVRLIEVGSQEQSYGLTELGTIGVSGEVSYTSAVFSPAGDLLAISDWDGRVRLWNVSDGSEYATLYSDTIGLINQVFYPLEGQAGELSGTDALLTSSYDGALILWNYHAGEQIVTRYDQGPSVQCVIFSPDGSGFAVGYDDGGVAFFSPVNSTPLWESYEHDYTVNAAAFSADGALLATGGQDQTVRLWNPADGSLLTSLETEAGVNRLVIAPALRGEHVGDGNNRLLIAGLANGKIAIWLVTPDAQAQPLALLDAHRDTVTGLSFSAESYAAVSSSLDGMIRVWNMETGEMTDEVDAGKEIEGLTLSPDGAYLVTSHRDSTVILWALDGGEPVQLSMEAGYLRSVVFSPDGRLLAVGSDWSRTLFWNPQDGSLLHTTYDHTSVVMCIAFSPDGHILVSVSHDGTIRIYGVP